MKKIIQITSDDESLYCLTEDGKVYQRAIKDQMKHTSNDIGPDLKTWYSGTFYWRQIKKEEKF